MNRHTKSRTLIACAVGLLILAGLPHAARAAQSVALVLDASGSMNGRLGDGTVKLAAAKQAVYGFVEGLGDDVRLSFRAYGHGSPRSEKNCRDTELLVDFAAAADVRERVVGGARGLRAQGYTPITLVIELAAKDLLRESAEERLVVLVSDGLETCEGDPCAAARALKDADAELVIHTVGFGVDDATRFQLQCIARSTGGTYFGADDADALSTVLQRATRTTRTVVIEEEGPGWLEIENADMLGHRVLDPETGEEVARLSNLLRKVELPAGIYHVTFGNGVWKSVEVTAGETTVLSPGVLEVRDADILSHRILAAETGEVVATVSSSKPSVTLMPATFDVTFGEAVWEDVRVDAGQTTVLEPAILEVVGADVTGHAITQEGRKVGSVSSVKSQMPLPPGSYEVEIGGKTVPVDLVEGQLLRLERRRK
jgi:hypothetical protein